ncbi:MAG: recombinase family protein [Dysosmobacter sp.]|nr:recombinase family protein [Dysosmobacter sp.]
MTKRKILYGYHIQRGELTVQPQEAVVVRRIATLYKNGLSYQKISDTLNADGIPFSQEAPLWNKHKIKRLLENPRYAGANGYPAVIDSDDFQIIQRKIQSKSEGQMRSEQRPALWMKEYLRCACGGSFHRTAGPSRRNDTLYLKCGTCGKQFKLLDNDLLSEISKQLAGHDRSAEEGYDPSSEAVRLTNAFNRGLERPEEPEGIVKLILQGVSARYDCCPAPTESDTFNRPTEVDLKRFGQAVSHITISDGTITVHFK